MLKIRRPALLAAAVTAVSAYISCFCNFEIVCLTVGLLLAVAAFSLPKDNAVLFVIIFLGIAVLINSAIIRLGTLEKLDDFYGKNVEICGTVCNPSSYGEGYIIQTVKVDSINGERFPTSVKIRLISSDGFVVEQGEDVCVTAKLKSVEGNEYQNYNYSQSIYATGSNIKVKYVKDSKNIYALSGKIKNYVKSSLEKYLPFTQASVLNAVVVGDKENIDTQLYDNVVISGVSHMLVVSGMHLSVLCFSMLKLFRKMFSYRMASLLTLPIVILISIVCDFGYSIVRAGMVYIIFLLGNIMLKNSDSLSSLSMAVAVILIINPFALGSVSFLLSVGATLGIILITPVVTEYLKRSVYIIRGLGWLKYILEPLCLTLSATVFTLPVTMWVFGRLSIVGILTNVLTNYSVTIAMCVAIIALLLNCVLPFEPILNIAFSTPGICIKYFCDIVNFTASLPCASVEITKGQTVVIMLILTAITVTAFMAYNYLKENRQ